MRKFWLSLFFPRCRWPLGTLERALVDGSRLSTQTNRPVRLASLQSESRRGHRRGLTAIHGLHRLSPEERREAQEKVSGWRHRIPVVVLLLRRVRDQGEEHVQGFSGGRGRDRRERGKRPRGARQAERQEAQLRHPDLLVWSSAPGSLRLADRPRVPAGRVQRGGGRRGRGSTAEGSSHAPGRRIGDERLPRDRRPGRHRAPALGAVAHRITRDGGGDRPRTHPRLGPRAKVPAEHPSQAHAVQRERDGHPRGPRGERRRTRRRGIHARVALRRARRRRSIVFAGYAVPPLAAGAQGPRSPGSGRRRGDEHGREHGRAHADIPRGPGHHRVHGGAGGCADANLTRGEGPSEGDGAAARAR